MFVDIPKQQFCDFKKFSALTGIDVQSLFVFFTYSVLVILQYV